MDQKSLFYPIDLSDIPHGWFVATVNGCSYDVRPGFASGEHNSNNDGIPHFRPMNISRNGDIDLSITKYVSRNAGEQRLHDGNVLFNNTNSPDLVGKTAYIRGAYDWAYSNHMTRIVPAQGVHGLFLARELHYLWSMGYFKHRCVNHVNQASVGTKDLCETIPIVLPPTAEQHRIVSKLDELFSDLDAGVAALERAKAKLKRYRASVLKAAVEGRLTATWRKANPPKETGEQLLARILEERRKHWEKAQLAKFKAKGQTPPKGWRDKYVEPAKPDTNGLPELPAGWCWATVDQVSMAQRYGTSAKTTDDIFGVPVLRMGNIVDGTLDFSNLKYLPCDHDEFPELFLEAGDLLFNRTNSYELVGKTGVFEGCPNPCSYASYLIMVRLSTWCIPHFLSCVINSTYGREWIVSVVSQQVGQANVNGSKLSRFSFPLPPFTEQQEIMRIAECCKDFSRRISNFICNSMKRAFRLRQSILKRAFEGKLVPQDPKDEPASVLLERIKAERAASPATPARRGRKPKAASSEPTQGTPKRRGRPPKTATAEATPTAPKRRGRPPKRKEQ